MSAELTQWANTPFASPAEQVAAMASPRYSDPLDDAYRAAVAMKVALSTDEATGTSVRIGGVSQPVYVNTVDASQEAREQQDAEQRAAEAELAQQVGEFGSLAIRPPEGR